jgi:hypothetical protein
MTDIVLCIMFVAFLIFVGFITWINKDKEYSPPKLELPKHEIPMYTYKTTRRYKK